MIEDLKRLIQQATEEEAKSLLLHLLFSIRLQKETEDFTEQQLVKDLQNAYIEFHEYKKNQTLNENETTKKVHLLFGLSAAGSFKFALKQMGLDKEEKVIAFTDMYSYGPVHQLHEEKGRQRRIEWLQDHINLDDEYLDNYDSEYKALASKIESLPDDIPIVIWTGENAHEQTALRFALFLLKEKKNDIYLINTSPLYKHLFDTPALQHELLHTGEISPERWATLYRNTTERQPISVIEQDSLLDEWQELNSSTEVLRIWKGKSVVSVEEDYYDNYIIRTAARIHKKQKTKQFMKSARLIGELIGHLDDYLGDSFLEYRVRGLIFKGVLEIKGVPKAMRYYSVKLKQEG
ncbi:DUF1835 domain-containing protein [Bacillus salacetis]|uniref:DUF1835 domain-containing protein n=1 Tax=Bacillus salacetis TaxID=2315464 RepID=UPI003BA36B25